MKQIIIFVILLFGVLTLPTTLSNPLRRTIRNTEEGEEKETNVEEVPESIKEGAKYFQDIYNAQNAPHELEFGHVRETPDEWEQRFEKADFKKNSRQGKVRWGDKNGGYGEHYWDLNHGRADEIRDEEIPKVAETQTSIPRTQRQANDAEFINDEARQLYKSGKMQKHGGNYRKDDENNYERAKRENKLLDHRNNVEMFDHYILADNNEE